MVSSAKLTVTAHVCHYLGINRLFFFLNRRRKRILTYHNVLPDEHFRNRLHEGVSHSESVFREQIRHLARQFQVGLDLTDPRQLTLTFDDGYRNQHAVAYPILMLHGIKAYWFFTLDLLEGKGPLLIDRLLFWLSYVEPGSYQVVLEPNAIPIVLDIHSEEDRHRCWRRLYAIIRPRFATLAPKLDDEFNRCRPYAGLVQNTDDNGYRLRFTPIQPTAVAAMKAHGQLVGPHGKTHFPLAALGPEALEAELEACRQQIGKLYNTTVFSFPFGGIEESVQGVTPHGFSRGLSNTDLPLPVCWNYSEDFMPRMALPNTAEPAVMDFILSGAKHFLQHGRLLPQIQNKCKHSTFRN